VYFVLPASLPACFAFAFAFAFACTGAGGWVVPPLPVPILRCAFPSFSGNSLNVSPHLPIYQSTNPPTHPLYRCKLPLLLTTCYCYCYCYSYCCRQSFVSYYTTTTHNNLLLRHYSDLVYSVHCAFFFQDLLVLCPHLYIPQPPHLIPSSSLTTSLSAPPRM
jgi:hypothetical protein